MLLDTGNDDYSGRSDPKVNCVGDACPPAGHAPSAREFMDHLLAAAPSLRAYATVLVGSASDAEDLVQETLLRAWRYRDSFRDDVNARAWLFRILKNEFLKWTRGQHRTEDIGGEAAAQLAVPQSQEITLRCLDTFRAFERLSPMSREVLELLAAGVPYERAAAICCCSVGTFKSRVNRARQSLVRLVGAEGSS